MEIPIEKNDEYIVDIIDYGTDGEGIAKVKGYTIFVSDGLRGERCKIHVTKVLKSYAYAKNIKTIEKSKYRADVDCCTYKRCGGCSLRHIKYDETLRIKKEKVQNIAKKILGKEIKVEETVGMKYPYYYRNKTIYPISSNRQVGFFSNRTHNVIPINECKIQTKISQDIAKYIVQNYQETIYDEKTRCGILRNIMVREAFGTKEIMVVLVQTNDSIALNIEKLVLKYPQIKTIVINVNKENTNVVLAKQNIILWGDGYITDKLGDYYFKISPNSFYQINPIQTEKIYKYAITQAELKKNDVLCDLYCGIGTIGIFASKYVKEVYGIEIVHSAVENANENAKRNNVKNIEFIEGDVEYAFDKLLKKSIKPNAIIVDPPRKGLDTTTIRNLCRLRLDKVVYVSCNPATLMRDLKELSSTYEINNIKPFDNFCYTSHVECCAVMELKSNL